MPKSRIVLVALVVALAVAIGATAWWFSGPHGPARQLVGTWEIMGAGFEKAMKEAIGKAAPDAAAGIGDQFRSSERLHFERTGSCRHVQNMLGLTIVAEGTWQVTDAREEHLSVRFHKTKTSVRDQQGETQVSPQNVGIDWVVTVIEPDRLLLTSTSSEGQSQRFHLRRASGG